ncbi:MAG: amidohydrolase family protein [Bryobacteraceae bacterium]|nr:amidohydrolase family protein [Bryobacteraceae bacterium]
MTVDVNVSVSRWPFRRLPHDEPSELAAKLRRADVGQAWAASLDGLLHNNIGAANARLAETGRAHKNLLPFGSVNPTLPDWEEDLRRCLEVHRMPGLRLHPNYHGYALDDPRFARLLELAGHRRPIVQIALAMEDDRTQHPLLFAPPVDPRPLVDLAAHRPQLPLVLLNRHWAEDWELTRRLGRAGQVYFDFSWLERVGALAQLVREVSPQRVLFGSHLPLFYFESALLKVREAGLAPDEEALVLEGNARRLLGETKR